jgi:monoamine oxidase
VLKDVTVKRIEQGPEGVAASTRVRAGDTYEADYCICTVPAHCLTDIKWKPPLP